VPRRTLFALFAISLAAALARALTVHGLDLYSDEAYYFLWSLRPAFGYFDHPPMVAWLIAAGNAVGGHGELALRLPFFVCGGLASLFAGLLAAELSPHPRAPVYAALLTAAAPMLHLTGAMALPDAPVVAAYTAALWLIARARGTRWVWAGVAVGVALVSKYTAALLAPALVALVAWDRELRRELRTPWPWIGGAIAVALFLPTLLWDAARGFPSIGFQLNHGFRAGATLQSFGEFVVGQLLGAGPVAIVVGVAVLARARTSPERRVAAAALLPLAITVYANTRGPGEANWPAIVYPALAAAAATFLVRAAPGRSLVAASVGLTVVIATFFAVEQRSPRLLAGSSAYMRFHGWKELTREAQVEVSRVCARPEAECDPADPFVYTTTYRQAGELAFYNGWRRFGPAHGRVSQLDVWDDAPRPDETFFHVGDGETAIDHFAPRVAAERAGETHRVVVEEHGHELRRALITPFRAFAGAVFGR
jgi:4-amino-4-deoxy-L-arabinose transferase-like glycosyltransferase